MRTTTRPSSSRPATHHVVGRGVVNAHRATGATRPTVDRRASARRQTSIPVEVAVPSELRLRAATLSNISSGGLSFLTTRPIAPGTVVSIRIRHSDLDALFVARVAWCQLSDRGYDAGVRFFGTADAPLAEQLEQLFHETLSLHPVAHA